MKKPSRSSVSPSPATAGTLTPRAKLGLIRTSLESVLLERDREIEATLACLVAGEHLLLVGPPGTAKSFTLDCVFKCLSGDFRQFKYVLNKATEPGELFGPISMADLTSTTCTYYRRLTDGYLPDSHFIFLDEVFKCNSATLNSLLLVLNEREFRFGRPPHMKCPLIQCVAASNEYPTDPDNASGLQAVFDRFLVRLTVEPIKSIESLTALAFGGQKRTLVPPCLLTLAEIDEASREVEAMSLFSTWATEAVVAWQTIIYELQQEGFLVASDRRKQKSVKMCAALAYLNGRDRVQTEDLSILRHVLWDEPEQQPAKVAKVVARVACPASMTAHGWALEIEDILSGIKFSDSKVSDERTVGEALGKINNLIKRMEESPAVLAAARRGPSLLTHAQSRRADLLRAAAGAGGFVRFRLPSIKEMS